jgi:hypothetical protein
VSRLKDLVRGRLVPFEDLTARKKFTNFNEKRRELFKDPEMYKLYGNPTWRGLVS